MYLTRTGASAPTIVPDATTRAVLDDLITGRRMLVAVGRAALDIRLGADDRERLDAAFRKGWLEARESERALRHVWTFACDYVRVPDVLVSHLPRGRARVRLDLLSTRDELVPQAVEYLSRVLGLLNRRRVVAPRYVEVALRREDAYAIASMLVHLSRSATRSVADARRAA